MDQDDCSDCRACTWKAEQGTKGRQSCFDAGKTEIPAPECNLNGLTPIDRLMPEVELGDNSKIRRIQQCERGRGFYIVDVTKDIETYMVCKREHWLLLSWRY